MCILQLVFIFYKLICKRLERKAFKSHAVTSQPVKIKFETSKVIELNKQLLTLSTSSSVANHRTGEETRSTLPETKVYILVSIYQFTRVQNESIPTTMHANKVKSGHAKSFDFVYRPTISYSGANQTRRFQ